jgi:hypothetical protein
MIQTVASDLFYVRAYVDGILLGIVPMAQTLQQQMANFVGPLTYVAPTTGPKVCRITVQLAGGTGSASALNANFINARLTLKDIGI